MRKVYVDVVTRVIMRVDDGVEIAGVIEEMDYSFAAAANSGATINDTEIRHFEVVDSK